MHPIRVDAGYYHQTDSQVNNSIDHQLAHLDYLFLPKRKETKSTIPKIPSKNNNKKELLQPTAAGVVRKVSPLSPGNGNKGSRVLFFFPDDFTPPGIRWTWRRQRQKTNFCSWRFIFLEGESKRTVAVRQPPMGLFSMAGSAAIPVRPQSPCTSALYLVTE
ncbi:hypothetical protein TNCV_32761 [Trichonephila clavipes]|nr:hypothetical protein TNCV_32761 [Trichonephila clavipes]